MGIPRAARAAAALLALALPAVLPAADAGGTTGLAATLERFDHLQVGDATAVADRTLSSAHFQCTLKSGRAAPVRAGDEVVGLFFEGDGTMEYVSVDPVEAPVVAFNTRKASSLAAEKTDKGMRLRSSFKRVLWLASGEEPGAGTGAAAASLAGSFRSQREKFGRVHWAPPSYAFAVQRLNGETAPLVWAEMDGGKEDLVYRLEGSENPSEGISVLHTSQSQESEFRKYLWPVTLARSPVGRDRRDPPTPRFLVTDVDLELAASAGNDVKLSVQETIVPMGGPRSVLGFDLDSVAYAEAGASVAARSERVRKVTDEKGRALEYDHRNNELLVQLPEPAPPERPVKLRFEIDGDFLVRPGGDNYWQLGIWPWFPQPRLCEQYYTLHALVRVKKPFVPFVSGVTVRRESQGDENVLETKFDHPIQGAVVLAGKYDVHEEVRSGVTIRVATYAMSNPRGVKQLTDLAELVIGYYEQFLGPFPFPEYNILEINDYGFGQAPPGVMFITSEAFNPLLGDMNQIFSQGINERFAHEIAHQYWGHVVKSPSAEEQWLEESFAEYCAALFLKTHRTEAIYTSLYKQWKRRADYANEYAPIPLANRVWDPVTGFDIRTGLLYDKGPILLAALHKELGDETFLTFLKSYQKSFAWKFGTTRHVAGLLQYLTKKDYAPFFEKYFWGTAMP
ncbi:MAG TPA: M1 family aminopeptidase [Thermoanaerobaculia bacterium]